MPFPRGLKEQVWSFARQMVADGIARRAQGNISARDEVSGLIAVTPTAIPYDRLLIKHIAVVNLDGELVEGEWKPTSELPLHLAFYRAQPEVRAVIHSHAPYAALFSVTGQPLPMLLTEAAMLLGGPVPVAPYARPGTQPLADEAVRIADIRPAVILANHGLVTVGRDLAAAYDASLAVEATARTLWMARAMGAGVHEIDAEESALLHAAWLRDYHPARSA